MAARLGLLITDSPRWPLEQKKFARLLLDGARRLLDGLLDGCSTVLLDGCLTVARQVLVAISGVVNGIYFSKVLSIGRFEQNLSFTLNFICFSRVRDPDFMGGLYQRPK